MPTLFGLVEPGWRALRQITNQYFLIDDPRGVPNLPLRPPFSFALPFNFTAAVSASSLFPSLLLPAHLLSLLLIRVPLDCFKTSFLYILSS